MPYVERVVVAGLMRETKKMQASRAHTEGIERSKNCGKTSEAQAKVNERRVEEVLRWKLNANFSAGDYHLALHYYDKTVELEQAEADKKEFLCLLRKKCRRLGIQWKYIACTETKRMTNVHHHIIIPAIPVAILSAVWERVLGAGAGNISIKPLDQRGNHKKLANYLMKESRSTIERHKEAGHRYKRFTSAQRMVMPEPEYRVVGASKWVDEPRVKKGYRLLKDDDGETSKVGFHEISGYPWQEYFELWVGKGDPPKITKHRKRRRKTP